MNSATANKSAAAAFGLSAIFPPFLSGIPRLDVSGGCGYGFIFFEKTSSSFDLPCRVDIPLLFVEWVFIAICLMVVHRRTIAQAVAALVRAGRENRQTQVILANKQADVQCEVARIIASAIVQHAEEQRKQRDLF